jgi:hypothetical protein
VNSSQEKLESAKRGAAAANFHLLDFPLGFSANVTNASVRARSRSQKRNSQALIVALDGASAAESLASNRHRRDGRELKPPQIG